MKRIEKKYQNQVYQKLQVPDQLDQIKSRLTFESQEHIKPISFKFLQTGLSFAFIGILMVSLSLIIYSYNQNLIAPINDRDYLNNNTDAYYPFEVYTIEYRDEVTLRLWYAIKDGEEVIIYTFSNPFLLDYATFVIGDQVFQTSQAYGAVALDFDLINQIEITIYAGIDGVPLDTSVRLIDFIELRTLFEDYKDLN